MKKGLKIALLSVLGLVIVAGVLVWMEFGPLVKGAMSAEKLDDGLYYMEYKGDDGFKELMDRGGCNDVSVLASYVMEFLSKGHFKPDSINVPIKPVGCSTLTVKTPEDGVMMARNFDYPYGTALIMHTIPDEGYESITTFSTDFFGGNRQLEVLVTYIDACASAVGIANGLFIFFRLREQWIAWYICALLEAIINILSGQYVLLILKLGYFTNTTYGYIKWSNYIKTHGDDNKTLF